METIITYLKEKYHPLAIIVYGSYGRGTQTNESDFDAMVLTQEHDKCHDVSLVQGIRLDVFVYSADYFQEESSYGSLLPIYDGKVVWDPQGLGAQLKERIQKFVDRQPMKTPQEIQAEVIWCQKMYSRAQKGDEEGYFRWHWLLIESLEIFCDVCGQRFWGSQKTLHWMQQQYPQAFFLYQQALKDFSQESLAQWVNYLVQLEQEK